VRVRDESHVFEEFELVTTGTLVASMAVEIHPPDPVTTPSSRFAAGAAGPVT